MTAEQLQDRSRHYMQVYYEINGLTLITSLLSVFASLYIRMSLRKTIIMTASIYRKFIIALFVVICLFVGIIFHFLTSVMSFARLDFTKWLEGCYLLGQMTSDNMTLNVIEALCTIFMILGLYVMIFLSTEIEFTIRRIDQLREENKTRTQVNI